MSGPSMRDGLLLVDKHGGCTSHDVVQQARRLLKQKKIGHCGTLDPTATGLLLLTLGRATRLTRFLIRAPKVYEGEIRFGIETDTYDAAGTVLAERALGELDEAAVEAAMADFVGVIQQTPPRFSAKKIQGQRYYELARRGEEVPQEAREVTVYEFTLTGPIAGPIARFRLGCSSGTYARSLAHDLGRKLGCGAHLAALRRTQIGGFKVESSATLATLEERLAAGEDAGAAFIPFDEIPMPFPDVLLDLQQEQRLRQGQTVLVRDLAGEEGDWIRLVDPRRRFLGVATVVERIGDRGVGVLQPRVVFSDHD